MTTEAQKDVEFVEYVVKSIVNHPDKVHVTRTVDEMGVLLTLNVDPEDMALVIGKAGNTAKAIRTLARIIGLRNHARVNFRIAEPEGSTRGQVQTRDLDQTKDLDQTLSELNV